MSGMYELCGHEECDFGSRAEYCKSLPSQRSARHIVVAVGILKALLGPDPTSSVTRGECTSTVVEAGKVTRRSVSYISDDEYLAYVPIETRADICRMYDNRSGENTYGVAISLRQVGATLGECVSRYTIETSWDHSDEAQVEQRVFGGTYESRPMTEYDCRLLLTELTAFCVA